MELTIHNTFLPADNPEVSLTFWRDTMGFEVRNDVGYGDMRWITVGPPGQPQTSIVLHPPAVDPALTDDEKRVIAELMAKGSYASIVLSSPNVDEAFETVQKNGADVVQEPIDQPYGLRDCAFRDPAGNMVRINQAV
ncbi:VOC family protein [Paractinoplanes brasiliensis]|uniref:Putative glyoxalase superfamily protein PhnB n=1 Tax=Paractinoplanes brasiliensis TaxID=52695 RepID=A0A4R6J6G3_9ACTN|nr:VOC family protein [Actinoplanes brasiliensis]TDO31060.1 putative glyoxalase superfamily protein PhnB [Actinoplanes brasiliensis]GID33306.1 glyoxalase [Actinoplanes brasiliensis]